MKQLKKQLDGSNQLTPEKRQLIENIVMKRWGEIAFARPSCGFRLLPSTLAHAYCSQIVFPSHPRILMLYRW